MKTMNLKNHAYSQCFVRIYENGDVDFISYTTLVLSIRYAKNGRTVECTGLYSATTRKQIGWFLREYAPDLSYYQIKEIAGEGVQRI